jgi:hypothetical protein
MEIKEKLLTFWSDILKENDIRRPTHITKAGQNIKINRQSNIMTKVSQ